MSCDAVQAATCESCAHEIAPLYCVGGSWYHRCTGCGLLQLSEKIEDGFVARVYDDSYFVGGGAGYPDYVAESGLLRDHGRRYARLLSKFTNTGNLLDVGGGAGYIAQGFSDSGWHSTVLEPNPRMASVAASLGGEAIVGTLETFRGSRTFDVIAMIQVIAHFVDLCQALRSAANLTSPGSLVLIETWNGESRTARFLKSQWHQMSPPSVRRIFTPSSLDHALLRYGFARVSTGRPQKWLSGSHARSLLAHKASSGLLARIASGLARCIPADLRIPYPAEDLFWSLYQKKQQAS